jgi:chromobox protein 1
VADLCLAALSDHESSDAEDVPAKAKGKQPLAKQDPIDDDDEEDDDSEIGEDE